MERRNNLKGPLMLKRNSETVFEIIRRAPGITLPKLCAMYRDPNNYYMSEELMLRRINPMISVGLIANRNGRYVTLTDWFEPPNHLEKIRNDKKGIDTHDRADFTIDTPEKFFHYELYPYGGYTLPGCKYILRG
jgi:hypothetical protein